VNLAINSTQGASQYTVGIIVSNYYTRSSSDDNTVVDVAEPLTSGFLTGGGFLVNQNSGGLDPGATGAKTNFGFNVKYNQSGTILESQVNMLVRNAGHVYQIKGSPQTSLVTHPCPNSLNATPTCPSTGTFNGTASIQDITNPAAPIPIDGNATLQVAMTDKGSPGTNDSIGITIWNSSGVMWFSSDWNGAQTQQLGLGAGDLTVH
jgi:hypothetical protein